MDFLDVLFWVFCLSLLCVFGGLLCVGESKSKKASINWTTEDLPDMVKCLRCGWVGQADKLGHGKHDNFSVCPNCKEENITTLTKNEQMILKYLCQSDWYE
ncbi:hypothetical protein KKA27_00845 [Patescibacteria group bacterium]|nr:hypothetical protein [Patescibacteria group bacterium]